MLFFIALFLVSRGYGGALQFASTTQRVDAASDTKFVESAFAFKNVSDQTVHIKNADAGCTCMGVGFEDKKLTYAPGEGGVLNARFKVGSYQGKVTKPIHIWMEGDAENRPSYVVNLEVFVPVMIDVNPKSVRWDLGDKRTQTIVVTMDYKKPIHVKKVKTTNEAFGTELVTVEKGRKYEIRVTPKVVDTPGLTVIQIETDADVARQRVQQAFGVMRSPK